MKNQLPTADLASAASRMERAEIGKSKAVSKLRRVESSIVAIRNEVAKAEAELKASAQNLESVMRRVFPLVMRSGDTASMIELAGALARVAGGEPRIAAGDVADAKGSSTKSATSAAPAATTDAADGRSPDNAPGPGQSDAGSLPVRSEADDGGDLEDGGSSSDVHADSDPIDADPDVARSAA